MTTQRSQAGTGAAIWSAVEQAGLPDKKYFKIGEVAALIGVEPHVLRYWQTQFPQVKPQKSRSGHRLYRRRDVESLLVVRELLHVQRFTIAGARQALRGLARGEAVELAGEQPSLLPVTPNYRPFSPPTAAVATEVACIDVEGVEDEEMAELLSRQLLEDQHAGDFVGLDLDPTDEGHAVRDGGVDPVGPRGSVAVSAAEGRLRASPEAPARFAPGVDRRALEAARAEVVALLERLDRADLEAARYAGFGAAAKPEA
ncbi:MAG: MerR family transcriptional regulator [Myxococcota bacterium]